MRYFNFAPILTVTLLLLDSGDASAQRIDVRATEKRIEQAFSRYDYRTALTEARKLEGAVKAKRGVQHPEYASILNQIGVIYDRMNQYTESADHYRRALQIYEQTLGPDHKEVAVILDNLAVASRGLEKFSEAEGLHTRALTIKSRVFGVDHQQVAITLNYLGILYRAQGRFTEAQEAYLKALAIKEKHIGTNNADVASTRFNLAGLYLNSGNFAEAETQYSTAIRVLESVEGKNSPGVAYPVNGLAILYKAQGKLTASEALFKRALSIRETALGPDHPLTAYSLLGLSGVLIYQGRLDEAKVVLQRSLEIYEKVRGPVHSDVAFVLHQLAVVNGAQEKLTEAEALYKRALSIHEKTVGPEHTNTATTLTNLASIHKSQHRYEEAAAMLQRALAILETRVGARHPRIGEVLTNLGEVYQAQNQYQDAESAYRKALASREQTIGANHPDTAYTLLMLANLYRSAESGLKAVEPSRKAVETLIQHAENDTGSETATAGGLIRQRAGFFRDHLFVLAMASRENPELGTRLTAEAFETAQWATHSSAAAALQQMSQRFAAGGGRIGELIREQQDLLALWSSRDKALVEAVAKPDTEQNRAVVTQKRRELAATESRLKAVMASLETEYPEFSKLIRAKPIPADEVRQLLRPDEALVSWVIGTRSLYVFAHTREHSVWREVPIGQGEIEAKVASFRRGLDVGALEESARADGTGLFSLKVAYELYLTLLGDVEELIRDKRHLIVVPSGALTAVPMHLLVSGASEEATESKSLAQYRNAEWLIKRHAISVLPSVGSLQALRLFAAKEKAPKAMIGFGDPIFGPETAAPITAASSQRNTRSYTDFWQGAGVDRSKLAGALPRLEDTADELRAIAHRLNVPAADVHLRQSATESTVKRANLSDYKIVYFATHGLVAGDVKGLAEPSLALTLPSQPNEIDDGLLTASEVAQLRLNADWVVLSACNTVAGEKPGAEALSGLARAFFYAGARALLVSHWAVASDAATRLATRTFDVLEQDAGIGRAQALRTSMLEYLSDAKADQNAYPAFWAPFQLVGDGAAR
jgi:CHAT domain-containing protein/Tfp pilus assembly protein PilF